MNIKFKTNGQSLLRCDDNIIAANGQKYLGAEFETDPTWNGYTITACFTHKRTAYHVILDSNRCTVPFEVLGAGEFFVSLIGVHNEDPANRITTEKIIVKVKTGPELEAETATEPTATEMEQALAYLGQARDSAANAEAIAAELKDKASVKELVDAYLADNPPLTEETDPTVPDWAKQPNKPVYTAEEVGADPNGTAVDKIAKHNISPAAHGEIRHLITELSNRLNAIADSEDVDLDQLSELVAYIKSNRDLIDIVTTSKVSVAAIVDNLTTRAANQPLSAAQGVEIKDLIDALKADKLDATALNDAINTALAQAKDSGKFEGADGKSAYEIYKEKGGTLTESEWLESLKGKDGTIQISPLFAESVKWLAENGDTSKVYILPDSFIYAYFYKESTQSYVNQLLISTEADGTPYNGGKGYKENTRLSSTNGGESTSSSTGYSITGFIPYEYQSDNDFVVIQGCGFPPNASYPQGVYFYDASHGYLGYAGVTGADYATVTGKTTNGLTLTQDSEGMPNFLWELAKTTYAKNDTSKLASVAYIRVLAGDLSNAIITVNEEIFEGGSTGGYGWYSTGNSFTSPNYDSRFEAIEDELKDCAKSSTQAYLTNRNTYIAPVPSGYCESKMTFTDLGIKVTEALKGDKNLLAMIQNFSDIATAHPEYVTETLLGKDASGTYDIYKYELDLKPAVNDGYSSVMKKEKPVFIITAGLHGIEPDAVFEVYHFMQDICNNYIESEHLEYLRTNVKFVIVPISNPWGFVNGTYNNSNDVNLNKNFEHGFSYVATTAGSQLNTGESAYSESEAVHLKGVFDSYPNAIFHLECHGKAGADNVYSDVIWFSLMKSLASELIEISANTVIHQIGRRLYNLGYNADKTEGGYITYYTLNGRPKDYTATEHGILSCTMEGTGRMAVAGHTAFTMDEQRINCEALENFILRVLDALNSRMEI